jgi:glyoxylase-like metal-dependent hydrolase (beta-lactamase superfamily II)
MRTITALPGLLICTFALAAEEPDTISGIELLHRFGIDVETAEITVQTLAPGLHVLFGAGGNVAASIGEQGVLIVDDQFPQMVPRIREAIAALGGEKVDFVINTHWHFDHADGNPLLAAGGSWIVSQANSRRMMLDGQLVNLGEVVVRQPPYLPHGLPVITYHDRMQFHFNGEEIELLHFGPAHTTGDAVVLFRGRNVVHMGDLYFSGFYPFIDVDNGGDLDGVISFCEAVLEEIDRDTVVIPGHGPVTGYAELSDYVAMLRTIRERLAAMIAEGATLAKIIAARPTAEWDEARGDPKGLLDRVYTSMTRARDQRNRAR